LEEKWLSSKRSVTAQAMCEFLNLYGMADMGFFGAALTCTSADKQVLQTQCRK